MSLVLAQRTASAPHVARKIKDADLDNLTPVAALELLRQLKAEL